MTGLQHWSWRQPRAGGVRQTTTLQIKEVITTENTTLNKSKNSYGKGEGSISWEKTLVLKDSHSAGTGTGS